jgi:hypothetical protein
MLPRELTRERMISLGRMSRAAIVRGLRTLIAALASVSAAGGCARPPECPDVHFDQTIEVPATSTTLLPSVPRFSGELTAGPPGMAVSIVDNFGTVAFEGRGPAPAFIYAQIPYPALARTLYAGLGIDDGVWLPFWLYCSDDGHLTRFDGEMTDRDLDVLEDVQGTCAVSTELLAVPLDIPTHSLRNVALTCGFSVSTPAGVLPTVDLVGSRPGTLDVSGVALTALPFHTVDCREGCGSPGWYEVHAVLWNPTAPSVGFGVFYLDQTGVSLNDGISLPDASPISVALPGSTWTLSR